MLFPPGFYGTRADILVDIVITSLVVIIPVILWSWKKVREKGYLHHRNIQLVLTGVLVLVLIVFETDLRYAGGIFAITQGSRYAGTPLLLASIYIHMTFSISTAVIWLGLIFSSMLKFPRPPAPNQFSRFHRFWGRLGMIDLILTGLTGLELYVVGLVL